MSALQISAGKLCLYSLQDCLKTSNAVQISDSGREMADKLYLGTHQDDPMLPVITPKFRFPAATLSLNPPQDVSTTKNLNAASLSDFSQKALSLTSTGICQGLNTSNAV